MKYLSFFLLVFIFLPACQSQKKINCSEVDWRKKGQKSSMSGLHENDAFFKIKSLCKKKKPFVDRQAFNSGYRDGLKLYCKTEVGLKTGLSGELYNNICSKPDELNFLKGYINGRIIFLKNELSYNKDEYTNAKDRFWRKEQEYLLIKSEDPEEAKMQRDFLEAYQEESNQLKKSVEALKKELSYLKRKKEELKFD